jgi:3-oxoacyl-[acyl-carrier protein] reductase
MFAAIRNEYQGLDILVNNAGIGSMNHALMTPTATVTRIMNTNVVATFLLSREAAKLMMRNKFGRIVNFATVATPLRLEGEAIYAASKAAVISLTQILGREFAPFGITVNAIGPTPIKTDLIAAVPQNKLESLLCRQAIPRFGEFSDVSNVIDFFIRPESGFITGQTIFLGGVS